MALWNDCRFGLRQLRKHRGFTITVVATLALCIGANTAVYSVLDAVLLRPLPFPEPSRLAHVIEVWRLGGQEGNETSLTGAQYEGVREHASSLDVAAYSGTNGVNFAAGSQAEYIQQQRVAAGFFRVLGILPQFGREFTRAEDVPGGPALAVLSYQFWQRALGGDASILGRAIQLRGQPYTVIGILPSRFRFTGRVDVWTPLRPSRTGEGAGSNYGALARLRPGVSWAAAAEQLKAISPQLAQFAEAPQNAKSEVAILPITSALTQDSRGQLLLTWGAVITVLLIGCVNIAGLLLARSVLRRREVATRMALGGGRGAIVRQLLIEGLLLALGGCVAGVALGIFALDWLKKLGADDFALWHPIQVDVRVVLAMLAIAVLTSLVFGLAPALQTSRVNIRAVLMEGGRGAAGSSRRFSRQVLVAAEIASSLVLVVSAGLLLETLRYLDGLNPGFDGRNVIVADASLQDARYESSEAVNRLFTESLDRMRRIPGVQSAAVALTLPYERPLNTGFRSPDGRRLAIEMVYLTPGYLATMRIPVLRGRDIDTSDTADGAKVVMVSESFAAKYYRGRDALGQPLELTGRDIRRIVGVIGDVQQHSGINGGGGPLSVEPTVYVPAAQLSSANFRLIHTWFSPKWVVRTAGPVGGIQGQMQAAIAGIDPQLPVAHFQTMDDLEAAITRGQRYHAVLFSIVAALALLLAGLGLYGLISQTIAQRTHELGVRMALGATPRQVMHATLRSGLALAGTGAAAGLLLSLVVVRWLRHLLFGVRPADPANLAASTAILLLIAIAATLIPAARVLRLDPAQTLREE